MTVDLDELERAANAIRPDQRGVPAFSAENVLALIADSRHLKAELDEAVGVLRRAEDGDAAQCLANYRAIRRTFLAKHGGSDG